MVLYMKANGPQNVACPFDEDARKCRRDLVRRRLLITINSPSKCLNTALKWHGVRWGENTVKNRGIMNSKNLTTF